MKKNKRIYLKDLSTGDYEEKSLNQFQEEFNEELTKNSTDEETFSEELKHIQKMALIGKLNPIHKQILEEWKDVHPDRFENFCNQMNNINRQKLMHFLHLDHEHI